VQRTDVAHDPAYSPDCQIESPGVHEMKRSKRPMLPARSGASPAAGSMVLGDSLAYFEPDGEADASPVSTQYRESWRRFFTTVFAALLLIGTEEGARAAFERPAAAGFGHHSASRFGRHLRDKPRCKDCSIVVSRREVEYGGAEPGDGTASADGQIQLATFYQFTLRGPDGSLRVITTTNAEAWREGERVSVIAGAKLASR